MSIHANEIIAGYVKLGTVTVRPWSAEEEPYCKKLGGISWEVKLGPDGQLPLPDEVLDGLCISTFDRMVMHLAGAGPLTLHSSVDLKMLYREAAEPVEKILYPLLVATEDVDQPIKVWLDPFGALTQRARDFALGHEGERLEYDGLPDDVLPLLNGEPESPGRILFDRFIAGEGKTIAGFRDRFDYAREPLELFLLDLARLDEEDDRRLAEKLGTPIGFWTGAEQRFRDKLIGRAVVKEENCWTVGIDDACHLCPELLKALKGGEVAKVVLSTGGGCDLRLVRTKCEGLKDEDELSVVLESVPTNEGAESQ